MTNVYSVDGSESKVWELFTDRKLFDVTTKYGNKSAGHVLVRNFGEKSEKIGCGYLWKEARRLSWGAFFTMVWASGEWSFEVEPFGHSLDDTFPMPKSKKFSDDEGAACVRWLVEHGSNAPVFAEVDAPYVPNTWMEENTG